MWECAIKGWMLYDCNVYDTIRTNFTGSAVLRWNLSAKVKPGSSLLNIIQIYIIFFRKAVCDSISHTEPIKKKKRIIMLTLLNLPKIHSLWTPVVGAGCRGLPGRRSQRHVRESVRAPVWNRAPLRLICTAAFTHIRATCTGCPRPACALGRAPARSPSPAAGCGSDAAAASFPPTRSGAEARAPAGEGRGGWALGSPAGRQNCDWSWWSRRTGADWRCGPGCSEPSWAQNSTDGVRRGRGERLRTGKEDKTV